MLHGQIQLTGSKSIVGPELDIVGFLQLEPSHSVLLKVCVVRGPHTGAHTHTIDN